MHLPGKITYKEIDEMIHTVDKNGDGKISYSEFRYISVQEYFYLFGWGIHNILVDITPCKIEDQIFR